MGPPRFPLGEQQSPLVGGRGGGQVSVGEELASGFDARRFKMLFKFGQPQLGGGPADVREGGQVVRERGREGCRLADAELHADRRAGEKGREGTFPFTKAATLMFKAAK